MKADERDVRCRWDTVVGGAVGDAAVTVAVAVDVGSGGGRCSSYQECLFH